MGNLRCLAAQCRRGDEVILGKDAHIFKYEGAGASGKIDVHRNELTYAMDDWVCLPDRFTP